MLVSSDAMTKEGHHAAIYSDLPPTISSEKQMIEYTWRLK